MKTLQSMFGPPRALCPICGKPSYSREGLHPQCAFKRAFREQQDRLREEQQADASTRDARPA